MYSLQTSVQIGQASFEIRNKGDFRMVLDCFSALNDEELNVPERIYAALIIFYKDFNDLSDIVKVDEETLPELQKAMMRFFNGGQDTQENKTSNFKLFDWDKDSNLICAAINNVAKQEVRALDYLHWWTFLGYYMSVSDSLLTTVISIRYKMAHHEKLEKHERKFKAENPEYFNIDLRSVEQKEADEYIKKLWGE